MIHRIAHRIGLVSAAESKRQTSGARRDVRTFAICYVPSFRASCLESITWLPRTSSTERERSWARYALRVLADLTKGPKKWEELYCDVNDATAFREAVLLPWSSFATNTSRRVREHLSPNFFVVGAHKAGTTSFCELLASHPDVFVSSPKEPSFFAHPRYLARGLSWYEGLFASARSATAIGEGSTLYSQSAVCPGTAQRIKEYCPAARIFYLVRHPLRRIESAWVQYRGQGRRDVPDDFSLAVRTVPQLIEATRYLKQLQEYRTRFADVSLIFFDDFIADPFSTLRDAYSFLGVDPSFQPSDPHRPRNPSAGKQEIRPVFRKLARLAGSRPLRLIRRELKTQVVSPRLHSALFLRLTTRAIERPAFDTETRDWVLSQLRSDTERLLREFGKSSSYWTLD